MVSNTPTALDRTEALRLRQQASDLLQRLMNDREQSERRYAETGRRDPMKFITGRTALDNAIASTRQMISSMDQLLEQMSGGLTNGNGVEKATQSDGVPIVAHANGRTYATRYLREKTNGKQHALQHPAGLASLTPAQGRERLMAIASAGSVEPLTASLTAKLTAKSP